MNAITGTALIYVAFFAAGWIGYQMGINRGMQIMETKRRRFK